VAERPLIDWSDRELIERLRMAGDPYADGFVAGFVDANADLTRRDLPKRAATEMAGSPRSQEAMIDRYLREQPELPDWARPHLIKRGQSFFRRHVWPLNLAFLLGSLPLSYCGADGALVLDRTGGLRDDTKRRVFETALLVMELAEPGELRKGGYAYLMVRRLRLMHAVVRRVLTDPGLHDDHGRPFVPWDDAVNGRPVCQLDLLGTLWAFALTSLTVLEKNGIQVSDRDREAWIHLWNVVGHLLGVDLPDGPVLLPMAEAEAEVCFAAVRERQFRRSPEGSRLAARLVETLEEMLPLDRPDWLIAGSIRHYLGDEYAGMLELPPARADRFFVMTRRLTSRRWGRFVGRPLVGLFDRLHVAIVMTLSERIAEGAAAGRTMREPRADDYLSHHLDKLIRDFDRSRLLPPGRVHIATRWRVAAVRFGTTLPWRARDEKGVLTPGPEAGRGPGAVGGADGGRGPGD
jgi:hypothetical protein